jgi:hypothetical protein
MHNSKVILMLKTSQVSSIFNPAKAKQRQGDQGIISQLTNAQRFLLPFDHYLSSLLFSVVRLLWLLLVIIHY